MKRLAEWAIGLLSGGTFALGLVAWHYTVKPSESLWPLGGGDHVTALDLFITVFAWFAIGIGLVCVVALIVKALRL
jgi:hypothetical protein